MKKRIVFGSVVMALLMLVSAILVVTIPQVKSIEPEYAQPQLKPDLIVWDLDIDTLLGGWYRLTVKIKNVGNGSAGPFYDCITWDNEYPLVNPYYHSGLGSLEVDTYYIDFEAQRGLHKITVYTDCTNLQDEWNEGNNEDHIWYYYWWL